MGKYILFLLLFITSFVSLASTPSLIQPEGKNQQNPCIERNTQSCIRALCIRSADLDCNDKCLKAAQEKCVAVQVH